MIPPLSQFIALGLAVAGVFLFFAAIGRLVRLRVVSGTLQAAGGALLLAGALALLGVAANLRTYQRLSYERPVAEIELREMEPGRFYALLDLPGDEPVRAYVLDGDEWQLDARVIKWRGLANLLGLDSVYRLDRLSGRYTTLQRERSMPRSVYGLSTDPGLDVWMLATRHGSWLPLVDAEYGSAAFLPMRDGARFQVMMTQSGLIARPANQAAHEALASWR